MNTEWKLVPVEPTDEMEVAAENDYEQTGATFPRWKSAYAAMMNAAPPAPTSHPIPTGATGEDERKAFEAWWRRTRGLTIAKQHYFELPEVYSSWEAWQARASVDAPAADDAEVES